MKVIQFSDPIYFIDYLVLIGSQKKTNKYLKKNKIPFEIDNESAGLTHLMPGDRTIIIWLESLEQDIIQFSTLIHELFHATLFALQSRYVEMDVNAEAYAYYIGFLTREILEKHDV